MNRISDNHDESIPGEDGAGGLYRSVGAENAPPHLDEEILRLAAREASTDSWFTWFIPWIRPAAFIATVGLSFALLLEFNNSSTPANTVPAEINAISEAADVLDDFSAAAADSSSRIRNIGETAAERSPPGDPTVTIHTDTGDPDQQEFCDDKQTATPESWWRCIEALRADGRTVDADTEFLRLQSVHPDFPANLQ